VSLRWLALVDARPADALAAAAAHDEGGAFAGYLAAWSSPRPQALRAWAAIVDPEGEAALVSLVLPPAGVRLAFDDLAVQQARRQVLAGRPADACSTLLVDDSRFAGALTAWRGVPPAAVPDDPFARIFPARVLHVGSGVIGRSPAPCGPTIERYGSASPWPGDRFGG
jgi:hypothetical protein